VHQHAERAAYPAPYGGDAVPDGLVLGR
jgi:hypothetical protein